MLRPPKQKKSSPSKRPPHKLTRKALDDDHFAAVRIREQEHLERKKKDALQIKSICDAAWQVLQHARRDPNSGSGKCRVQSGRFTIGLTTPFNPGPRKFNSEKLEHRFEWRLSIWRPRQLCLAVIGSNWVDIRVERIHHDERWRKKFLRAAKYDEWQ